MKRLIRPLSLVMAGLALAALAACVDRKSETSINPDGSGKVVVVQTMAPPPDLMGGPDKPKPDPEKTAVQAATRFITSSKGVDAWKDVSYKVTDDGSVELKATAYFPDIAKLQIEMMPPATWTKDEAGNYTLAFDQKKPAASQPTLTDEQVAAQVKQQKMQYRQMQPMMQMMFGTLRLEMNYTLPGKVKEVNIYEKTGENKAGLVFEGKKFLEAMDKIMKDDAKIEAMVRAGSKMDQDMGELVFGKKGDPKIVVADGGKPVFDYKAESDAAKAAQEEMFKKLNIDPTKKPNGFQVGPSGMP
jgi:hypothetical protein